MSERVSAGTTREVAMLLAAARGMGFDREVRDEARRTLVNYVACAIGGSGHDTVERAVRALGTVPNNGAATLFGRRERPDAFHAALLNGISTNVFGFDDTHLATIIHPAGPVASALFALADLRPVSGEAFLRALIIGIEIECRIGLAAGPRHGAVGWHVTGTAGVFGAAAAAGLLLGLDTDRLCDAIGLAACQPVGLRHNFGSMAVSFHVGRAAQNGLTAAVLAEQGFTAGSNAIDGPAGWMDALAPDLVRDVLTRPLVPPIEIAANTYKPFASGIVTHPAMEAAIVLAKRLALDPVAVRRITVRAHPLVRELTGNLDPQTALQSKVSISHAVAVALVERLGGPEQFSDRALRDPTITRLRACVELVVDPLLDRDAGAVVVELADGTREQDQVLHAIGSSHRPMSDGDLDAKFRTLADGILSPERQRHVLALIADVEALADVSEIARSTRPESV